MYAHKECYRIYISLVTPTTFQLDFQARSFFLFVWFFLFTAKLCCILIHFLCAEAIDVNKPNERRCRQLSRCPAQIVLS